MRILVISYSYPPANNPRSTRWKMICEYWSKKNINVDVVCAHTDRSSAKFECMNGVDVYRVKDLAHKSACRNQPVSSASGAAEKVKAKILARAKLALKKIVFFFRWPDYAWLWIWPAYKKARDLTRQFEYDAVVSVAFPFSSHMVALMLRVKNIQWLSDFGDPLSFSRDAPLNNFMLYGWLNKYFEKKIILSSDKATVTTPETIEEYSCLGLPASLFEVIPPVLNIDDTFFHGDSNNLLPHSHKDKICLVYAGALYSKIRNPRFLLEFLSPLSSMIEIHFYSSLNDCKNVFDSYSHAINSWIYLHEPVSKDELLYVYEKADVLVNIGNKTSYQLPSKVIEYIATGLPILNIASIRNDSSARVLQDYPAAYNLYQDNDVTQHSLDGFLKFFKNSQRVGPELVNKISEKYRPEIVAQSYLNIILKECAEEENHMFQTGYK